MHSPDTEPTATPLHEAAAAGRRAQITRLVTGGAALDAVDEEGRTPLMRAAAGGHKAAVAELLQLGAAVDLRDPRGESALVVACKAAHASRVHDWRFAGSQDVVVRDGVLLVDGQAVQGGKERAAARNHACPQHVRYLDTIATIETLVQAGASVVQSDGQGVSALALVEALGRENTVRMMRSRQKALLKQHHPEPPDSRLRGTADELVELMADGLVLAQWPRTRSSRDGLTLAILLLGDDAVQAWLDAEGRVDHDYLELGDRAWLRHRLGDGAITADELEPSAALTAARGALVTALAEADAAIGACPTGQGLRLRDGRVLVPGEPWHVLAEERQRVAKVYPRTPAAARATLVTAVLTEDLVGPEPIDPSLLQRVAEAADAVAAIRGGEDAQVATGGVPRRAFAVLDGQGFSLTFSAETVTEVQRAAASLERVVDALYEAVPTGRSTSLAVEAAVDARVRPLVRAPETLLDEVGRSGVRATVEGRELFGVGGRYAHGDQRIDREAAAALLTGWSKLKLREAPTDLDARDTRKRTALIRAAKAGRALEVTLLLEAGADPGLVDKAGMGAIHWATLAHAGAVATLGALLDGGVPVDLPGGTGRSALVVASLEGATDRAEVVRLLLARGAAPDGHGPDGVTALYGAAYKGKAHSTEALLHAGASPDLACGGWTPLMLASIDAKHIGLVPLLVRAGASVDLQNDLGETALYNAAERGLTETCLALLEAGADPGLRTRGDEPKTPADAARSKGHDATAAAIEGWAARSG